MVFWKFLFLLTLVAVESTGLIPDFGSSLAQSVRKPAMSADPAAIPLLTPSEEVKAVVQKHTVMFFSGLDAGPHYFEVNSAILRSDFGLEPSDISIIYSKTGPSFEDNSEILYGKIISTYDRQTPPKPLILVGHSEGGLEILLATLNHPDLLSKGIVDRIVTIDAPLRGSPIADLVKYWGDTGPYPWEKEKPILEYEALRLIDAIKHYLMHRKFAEGFDSLTTTETSQVLGKAYSNLNSDQRSDLSSKLFSVVSYMDAPEELAGKSKYLWKGYHLVFGAVHDTQDYRQYSSFTSWLSSFGKNDGLVPVSSQCVAEFGGTMLGPFEGNHSWSVKVQNRDTAEEESEKIKGFTRNLFTTLFKP